MLRLPHLKKTICTLTIAPLLFTQPAISAPAKKRAPAKRAVAPVPKITPIEALAGQLAMNSIGPEDNVAEVCRRTDFKLLATALSMNTDVLHQEKGEYETTEQYTERVSKLSNAVNGNDLIFCQPLNDNEDLPFVYNADLQRFEASFDRNQNVWRDVKQLGSYRSKTRMGAAATVKASVEFEYNVSLTLPQDDVDDCGYTSSYYSSYKFQVPVQVADAPLVKARGYLAFIGKLVPSYISESEQAGSPTLDDPYDEYKVEYDVKFKPTKIVLVDGSGKEFWKCTPGLPAPNAAPKPKGNPGAWVSSSDYPSSALRDRQSGTVSFNLIVDRTGAVTDCYISSSSGFPDLDLQTCSVLKRRASFKPATDSESNPTDGIWASSFHWKL